MDRNFCKFINKSAVTVKNKLLWFEDKEVGYLHVQERNYDQDYFNKYVGYAQTERGIIINNFRIKFVKRFTLGRVLDIGIGCGSFIEGHGEADGFDINPQGIKWLVRRDKFRPLNWNLATLKGYKAVTFFDSFEHIKDHWFILDKITDQYVIMSIPIFKDLDHAVNSKHFRPDEHYYYFTCDGLFEYMASMGFAVIGCQDGEIKAGREDILTFAFRRVEYISSREAEQLAQSLNKLKVAFFDIIMDSWFFKLFVRMCDKIEKIFVWKND